MTYEVSDETLRLAESAAAPAELSESARRERFGPLTQVRIQPGQLWRAVAEDVVVFLLVIGVHDAVQDESALSVLVAPVSVDPPAEDDHCLVVSETANVFGVEVTIWAGLSRQVPIRVLDDVLDVLANDVVRDCRDVGERGELPQAIPAGCRRGRPLQSVFDLSLDVRSELEDELGVLLAAPGLPVAAPGQGEVARLDITLAQVMRVLEIGQPAAMRFLRGKYPIEPEQAARLAAASDLTETQILSAVSPLPVSLVHAVEHPGERRRLRQLASATGVTEHQARQDAAYGVSALAARETGATDWRLRLEHWLDAKLEGQATIDGGQ